MLVIGHCNSAITSFLNDRVPDPWTKRRKITIDNTAQAENLVNFPVMVRVDATRIDYANTQDAGQDIQFRDSDGRTVLSHEIEKWNESGSSYIWVKVPQIDASSASDHIYLYYGNSAALDGQNATGVWDANFKGVWHMTSSARDATANGHNGTNVGTVTTVTGKSGDARSFNGASQYINLSGTSIVSSVSTVTLSTWVNRSGNVASEGLIAFSIDNGATPSGTSRLALELVTTRNLNGIGRAPDGAGSGVLATTSNPLANIGTWYLVSMAINYSSKSINFYVDGSLVATGTSLAWTNSVTDSGASSSAALGAYDDGTVPFLGSMDEIRFSNIIRSAAWHAADYKSMNDTLLTFSSEETPPGLP